MAKKQIPTLVGINGYSKGEKIPLRQGKTLVGGRAAAAEISVARFTSYLILSDEEQEADEDFFTISRMHFLITVHSLDAIQIKNLSSNGTLVDGKLIDSIVLDDVSSEPHTIEIGAVEKFTLTMSEHEVDDEGQPIIWDPSEQLTEAIVKEMRNLRGTARVERE